MKSMMRICACLFFAGIMLSPAVPVVYAVDTGLDATAEGASFNTNIKFEQYTGIIIKAVLSILGVIFLGVIIYAGLMWITSQGEAPAIAKARDMIIWAVIGLGVVLAAYAATNFIIDALTAQTLK